MTKSWYAQPDLDGVFLGKPLGLSCAYLAGKPGTGRYLLGTTVNPKNRVYHLRKAHGEDLVIQHIVWAQGKGGKQIVEQLWNSLAVCGIPEGWYRIPVGLDPHVLPYAADKLGLKAVSQRELVEAIAQGGERRTQRLLEQAGAAHLV